jgi:uncharacterized iron-regulated membrane protein
MGRAARFYLLDVVLALLAVLLALSSSVLWMVLPRGFSPSRRLWVDVHKWGGLALGVAVLLHVALHWSWLVGMTRRYLSHLRAAVRPSIRHPSDLAQGRQ